MEMASIAAPTSFTLTHPPLHLQSQYENNRWLSRLPVLRFQLPHRCGIGIIMQNSNHLTVFSRMGAVGGNLESTGVPTSVPVRVAHELLQAGHRYLDVRTVEEFSAAHVPGAINVPYMFRTGSGMTKNPSFINEVASQFGKDDEIIIGCQSGKRSFMAAADLLSHGFTGITDIAGGYAAWTQIGLPSES